MTPDDVSRPPAPGERRLHGEHRHARPGPGGPADADPEEHSAPMCGFGSSGVSDGRRGPRASLAWVVTEGTLQNVSTWAHLPLRERPRNTAAAPRAVVCPVCERPVVLKLGRKVVHHAAHAPGDPCVVTQPETALHFNIKCHIAAQLSAAAGSGRALRVTEACMVGQSGLRWERRYDTPTPTGYLRHEWLANPCKERRGRVWLDTWDRVELERRVGDERAARIPDVVLFRDGVAVAAIEVFHSHSVDEEKASALAALGVSWVEVRADEALLTAGSAWTLDVPLPAHRVGPSSQWRCAKHEVEHRAALEAEAREREAARHTRRVCAAKLVDVLYPSGKSYRNVYSVVELSTDGTPHAVALERSGETLLTLPLNSAPKLALWTRLKERCAADIQAVEHRRAARTDSPMEWATGALAERIVSGVNAGLWRRVPLERTHPLRWRFAPGQSQWFLPPDLRDVSWDRAPDDPLEEPHAAWERQIPGRGATPVPPPIPTPAAEVAVQSVHHRARPLRPVRREDLGPAVTGGAQLQSASLYELRELPGAPERLVVVPAHRLAAAEVRRIDDLVRQGGVERLWIVDPQHWPKEIGDVPWLPLVVVGHAGLAVEIHGQTVPLADAISAWADGALRLTISGEPAPDFSSAER